jgi:predicted metal-dependent hydrolase
MSTDDAIQVRGLRVKVVRKAIKNLHLGVYPPNGRVRVAAPMTVSNEAVRLAVIGKLGWISRQRRRFLAQPRQSKRELVSGESHYFLGRRYRLRVLESEGVVEQGVKVRPSVMELRVRAGAAHSRREAVLTDWYREQLRELAAPLIVKWERVLGVRVSSWGIRRMRTKWGTCNADARRVWLNLELAKVPRESIEYIVVHELVHLIARRHDERFFALMDRHLPNWRARRELLNTAPLVWR